jgi:hypothetical protein
LLPWLWSVPKNDWCLHFVLCKIYLASLILLPVTHLILPTKTGLLCTRHHGWPAQSIPRHARWTYLEVECKENFFLMGYWYI